VLYGWVVREGLTNVVRHARATRCTITLTADAVEIVDDGQAASASASATDGEDREGSGLRGLHERVTAADGTLASGPGGRNGSWRLRAWVPPTLAAPPTSPSSPASRTAARTRGRDDGGMAAGPSRASVPDEASFDAAGADAGPSPGGSGDSAGRVEEGRR
jgi:hypothetical protein